MGNYIDHDKECGNPECGFFELYVEEDARYSRCFMCGWEDKSVDFDALRMQDMKDVKDKGGAKVEYRFVIKTGRKVEFEGLKGMKGRLQQVYDGGSRERFKIWRMADCDMYVSKNGSAGVTFWASRSVALELEDIDDLTLFGNFETALKKVNPIWGWELDEVLIVMRKSPNRLVYRDGEPVGGFRKYLEKQALEKPVNKDVG